MNIEIANKLVELRKQHNLSQEELAEKLGISRQAISKWERAESSPDTDNLIALAKLYNISLDELLINDKNEIEEIEVDEPEVLEPKVSIKFVLGIKSIFPLTIVIIYIIIGSLWGLWHPGWILFLLIPVFESLVDCFTYKDIKKFEFPVLISALYMFIGCVYNLWHPWWVVFLLIPIYYSLINSIKRK